MITPGMCIMTHGHSACHAGTIGAMHLIPGTTIVGHIALAGISLGVGMIHGGATATGAGDVLFIGAGAVHGAHGAMHTTVLFHITAEAMDLNPVSDIMADVISQEAIMLEAFTRDLVASM